MALRPSHPVTIIKVNPAEWISPCLPYDDKVTLKSSCSSASAFSWPRAGRKRGCLEPGFKLNSRIWYNFIIATNGSRSEPLFHAFLIHLGATGVKSQRNAQNLWINQLLECQLMQVQLSFVVTACQNLSTSRKIMDVMHKRLLKTVVSVATNLAGYTWQTGGGFEATVELDIDVWH